MKRSQRALAVLTAVLLLPACFEAHSARPRPNMILFLADDQSWTDSGVYGNPDVKTPNIDRLASEGMRFTHAFTATAMCAPTRQQLYTGLYPVRSGAYPQGGEVNRGTRSIAHYFKDLGYRVGISGKRHFGPLSSFPFELVGSEVDKQHHLVDLHAVSEFVNRDPSQPFFLVVASNNPHFPWHNGSTVYHSEALKVPSDLVDTKETRLALADYYREVSALDAQLGHVDLILEASGQAKNTILAYTSEQGSMFPSAKWTLYDKGVRVALIVRWPGVVREESVSEAMVHYVDFLPTLIAAAGANVTPTQLDGLSFLDVLKGDREHHREMVYGVHTSVGVCNSDAFPSRSVRSKRYKLIRNYRPSSEFFNNLTVTNKGGFYDSWLQKGNAGDEDALKKYFKFRRRPAIEFYDLDSDPNELKNIADDESVRHELLTLDGALQDWLLAQGDSDPVSTEAKARSHISESAVNKLNSSKCQALRPG